MAASPNWEAVAVCERIAALILLGATLPVMIAAGLAIRILSGRTPLIAHRRVGWNGSVLWMLKLRTMWHGGAPAAGPRGWIEWIEDEAGPARKAAGDDRIPHAFARFCRRHSLDELPQLWHVVRGEMALIGPRPVTSSEIRLYYGTAAEEVLRARPGIAGLWQTSGRNSLTYQARVRMDLEFVRNRSAAMYWRIFRATLVEIWTGRGAC